MTIQYAGVLLTPQTPLHILGMGIVGWFLLSLICDPQLTLTLTPNSRSSFSMMPISKHVYKKFRISQVLLTIVVVRVNGGHNELKKSEK